MNSVRGYAGFVPGETGGGGGGSGTVTSVDVAAAGYTSSGAVTGAGTVTLTEGAQSGNKVKASPADGSSGTPAYRALVAADIPSLVATYQPLDADLTAISALSTTSYGRGFLTQASAEAARGYIGSDSGDSVPLTDGTNIAVDASLGSYFRVTLGGNRTLSNPSNSVDGQTITVEVIQDGTGSRTLAYGANYAFSADVPSPILTITAAKRDFLLFKYNSTAGKWYCLAVNKGF